jgi:hypothetical protein
MLHFPLQGEKSEQGLCLDLVDVGGADQPTQGRRGGSWHTTT